ncbi:N-formylglutamate amidohydrolase [Ramlibacter sp. AN1015]|uniref:N-formylglutamate amidohydrolase n=1 Tax=Ramlibacter sp. AN1015 TaxID=3133428 RepID=UPI0030BB7AED
MTEQFLSGTERTGSATPPEVQPVTCTAPQGPALPLVFDSPHSGSVYPPDFDAAVSIEQLRRGEDRLVDELFAHAPRHAAVLVAARFPRTYIDPNRLDSDLDAALLDAPWPHEAVQSAAGQRGHGLIWRVLDPDVPIYERRLSVAEARRRIERFWRPYHQALQAALDDAHRRHGQVWHVNCHSMWSIGPAGAPDAGAVRPDFVLGDRGGISCAAEFTALVRGALQDMGYSVAVNHPYAGAELVARHGRPAQGRHSLQIEINRSRYMDERTLEAHTDFGVLQADLGRLAGHIAAYVRSQLQGIGGAR